MKLLKLILSSIIVSCLASCGGGSDSPNTDNLGNRVTDQNVEKASTLNAAIPESFPTGTTISFNPQITFSEEISLGIPATATYNNDNTSGGLPVASGNVLITMVKSVSGLILSFSVNGERIDLYISKFLDFGGTGFVDEFTVEARVDGVSLGTEIGHFTGGVKPRNQNLSKTFNTNRAPTDDEFKKYLVEKAMYTGDGDFNIFHSDGTMTSYTLNSFDGYDKDPIPVNYTYSYNNNDPRIKINGEVNNVVINATIKMQFQNFYQGTYEIIEGQFQGTADDGTESVFTSNGSLDQGDWIIYETLP